MAAKQTTFVQKSSLLVGIIDVRSESRAKIDVRNNLFVFKPVIFHSVREQFIEVFNHLNEFSMLIQQNHKNHAYQSINLTRIEAAGAIDMIYDGAATV